MPRFIFITGGVVSSLGKGLGAASLAVLLQARGFKVRVRKLDPYLNVDPGTMSPTQHGEVFVTDDGAETDLDLGHYERFTDVDARKSDNVTAGRIYSDVLAKERAGKYLGATIQVIPHVTDAIKEFITASLDEEDFVICEIGGTVGDIESLPFLEAIRQLGNELGRDKSGRERVCYLHVTLVPYVAAAGELKTKPTQHSVKELQAVGIRPDILLCRTEHSLPDDQRAKIAQFCNVRPEAVVLGEDVSNIYEVPKAYHERGLDTQVIHHFAMDDFQPDLRRWRKICKIIDGLESDVSIAVVGKYTALQDSYKSLGEALVHGGISNKVRIRAVWIDSEKFESEDADLELLRGVGGILVPGGFGERGSEGKIRAIRFARENGIPFFGICFGMQMAVLETARNVAGLPGAGSSEFGAPETPVVGLMTEWMTGNAQTTRSEDDDLGGTMRLGAYPCMIKDGTKAREVYRRSRISERHRHRYEVNIAYREQLEEAGMVISGISPDGRLPEIVERTDHPWFVGVQYHPELKSRPFKPHRLFKGFIRASVKHANSRGVSGEDPLAKSEPREAAADQPRPLQLASDLPEEPLRDMDDNSLGKSAIAG